MQIRPGAGPSPDAQLSRLWSLRGESIADGERRIQQRHEAVAALEQRHLAVKSAANDAIRAGVYAADGKSVAPGSGAALIAVA